MYICTLHVISSPSRISEDYNQKKAGGSDQNTIH
jgi:hypothetical protein